MDIYVNIFQKLDQTRLAESMNGNYSQTKERHCDLSVIYMQF